ncbi:hypothetical protein K2173_007101 [Erythroxylum novogranatense]|uniref:Uncharacterized protein n=1 Tax=Erythroxylum novogranatense TaxID=1862640 RepID=A0AAV8SZR0_9ROSI|nr:hypothetical protein K2173_007101 [Erythroxylum novogranatense]
MLTAASDAASWVCMRRERCLFLLLCSPILLPFLCATFPILCVAELCLRLLGRHRKKDALLDGEREEEEGVRRCEEGLCGCDQTAGEEGSKVGLLQRYLEDQLRLVGSIYECGDDDDEDHKFDGDDDPGTDTQIALLLD